MKTLALAAALCAAFFAAKPADATLATAKPADTVLANMLYNTIPAAGGTVNFSLTPGAQFVGDVFTPTAMGPICFVDGIFVDTGGANRNFVIVVSFWGTPCLGCPPAALQSIGYNITLPPLPNPPNPAVYRIRFPIAAPGFNYGLPLRPVGISFHVSPPGTVPPFPPNPCPVGVAPTLVPAFGAFPATVGTEVIGISVDIQAQDCCLRTNLNLNGSACVGTEWFAPRNLLVTLWDCNAPPPPAASAFHGPSIDNPFDTSDGATIELLDFDAIQVKQFTNLTDVDVKKS